MISNITVIRQSASRTVIKSSGEADEGSSRRLLVSSHYAPLLWLLLIGLILGFAFQGTRALWSPDEGRYVGGALQMLDSGNYLAPAYSPNELNFSKPPLTYWVIAAAMDVFGRNTWAARAPYAVAFALTIGLLYAIGKQLVPQKPWLPGLIYSCSVFPFLTANIISTDVLLTLFEALAVLGFIRSSVLENGHKQRPGMTLMWLGFGLAFLTKGPPGLLPLLAILAYIVICDGWKGVRRVFTPLGIVAFLISGFAWYVAVVIRYPWVLHYFLHDEVYGRIFTSLHRRHAGAFGWATVYLPVLIFGSLPWWSGVIQALRSSVSLENWRVWRRQGAVEIFLLLWFLIPLVVFCLSKSRLPLYVLPLFLPLTLLVAGQLRQKVDLFVTRQRVMLCLWLVTLITAKGAAAYAMHSPEDNQQSSREIAAIASPATYNSVIVIENTRATYDIEEQTPWGLRLYLNKPVYGVAWGTSDGRVSLCTAIQAQRSALLIINPEIGVEAVQAILTSCHVYKTDQLGTWRHNVLMRIQG